MALRALALGFRFSSDEDKSEPLESSLLDDELTSSDSGSFVTGSFCGSESSELEEESSSLVDLLDTLALFAGRSLSEESELEADESDELLSAFRLRLLG